MQNYFFYFENIEFSLLFKIHFNKFFKNLAIYGVMDNVIDDGMTIYDHMVLFRNYILRNDKKYFTSRCKRIQLILFVL